MASAEAVLHGREAPLRELRAGLESAIGGRGGLVLVSGEAGIGKSALVEKVAAEAERSGFRLLTGRAWESGDAPAYFPVRSGLRALGVTCAAAASDADAFALWEDTLEALATAAASGPVLWLIDDLHAADAQTIELLTFLAQPLRAISAIVLATVRSGDARTSGVAMLRLMRIVRDRGLLELGRLSEDDVAALAASVVGRPIPSRAVAAWMSRTGGNPLFVVECARAVRAGRRLETTPETLVDVTVERLRAIPPGTRALLEQGALHGREFEAGDLARLLGRLPAVVIDGLLAALKARLIEETAPGRFRFGHALVRDAIEEAMPAEERRAGHARLEAALAAGFDTPVMQVERARHAIEALPHITEERGGAAVERAAAVLEAEGAHDRAFGLWRRWLAARSAKPDARALLELSRLATSAGNHAESQRAGEEALALAKVTGDPVLGARAALALGTNPRPGIVDPAYVRVLEDAVARLPVADEPRLACLLRARLAAAMQPAADPSIPVAMARAALIDARAQDDDALLREVLVLGGSALTYFVNCTEAHALAGELLSLSLKSGDTGRALRAFPRRVIGHLELGDIAAFDDDVEQMLELTRATGHPQLTWRPLLLGSMSALARGNFEESARLITEVEEMSRLIDDPALVMSLRGHKANRALALDDELVIREVLATEVPELARLAGPFGAAVRALFAVRLGDRAGAANEIPALLRIARHTPPDSPILGLVGEAIALGGTTEERAKIFARLLPLDGREHHTAPIPVTYEGPVSRILGLLEASLGQLDAAAQRLASARARCRALGLRPWVARLALELGRVLALLGRTVEARASFDEAARLAGDLGMRGIESSARAELDETRATGSLARAEPRAAPVSSGDRRLLLAREGEVWKVSFGAAVVRVKDSRGVQLLAKLVASPDERVHVLALSGDGEAPLPETHAGEALDGKALAAYRARLGTIDEALAAAESRQDKKQYDALQYERQILMAEISRAVGLGGRLRKIGSATERARINATRRIKDAVSRIAEADAAIGRHLEEAVQTGTYCVYREKR